MSRFIIPGRNVETLRSQGGGDFVFAEGAYYGDIESSDVRPLPDKDGVPFQGYTSIDGERLSLTIGNITAGEGQPEPGARKFFVDLVLKDGKYTVEEYDKAPESAWQLARSARMIGNLAHAMGETEVIDGDENVAVKEGFVEALRNGFYNKQRIGFVVYHKANKKEPTKPYQEIETFLFAS